MKRKLALVFIIWLALTGGSLWWYHHSRQTRPTAQTKATTNSQTTQNKSQAASFNKQQYSIDDPASLWVVANKRRPLQPKDFAPTDLTIIGNGQSLRAEAAQAFSTMVADAKATGYTLVAESGYRSYATQVNVYSSEVRAFGQAKADSESARPGYSEHQTGWSVDIGSLGCYEDCFGQTQASGWVKTNAYKYGFILRYPADKSDVTGYRNEPWHFRYVGKALSTEMHRENISTLEEFFGLPAAPDYTN